MTVRHAALAAAAAVVVAFGVYLFVEVHAEPAGPKVSDRTPAREPSTRRAPTPERATGAEAPPERAPSRAPSSDDAEDPATAPSRRAREYGSILKERPKPPGDEPVEAPHKVAAMMDEANGAYNRGDMDEAKSIAQKVLALSPGNVRMLRVVVSAGCIGGEVDDAQRAFLELPAPDREQMKTRCARYGVTFKE